MGLGVLSSPGWLTPAALDSPLPKSWDQSETVAGPLWAFSLGSENCLLRSSLGAGGIHPELHPQRLEYSISLEAGPVAA